MTGTVVLYKSLKCDYCETCWPMTQEYDVCPLCQELTTDSATDSITLVEAADIAAHARFGWWLYEHDRV